MVMRVGGIVSGMDIEAMVSKLMEAERAPLMRLKQQQTQLEWKRDAYRDINSKLLELDNLMLDMKMTRTYNPKATTSSQENAVTATASAGSSNGVYDIEVKSIATRAMRVGETLTNEENENLNANSKIGTSGNFEFETYNADGTKQTHTISVDAEDTIANVLKKIEDESDGRIRAFFDDSESRVVLEATRTGVYHAAGDEITFAAGSEAFFENVLGLTGAEHEAKNAEFVYNNGLTITSRDNSYTLNGVTFDFHNVTDGNARISVTTDVDSSFDKIMNFVNKYNEVIETMNTAQTEQKYRDYLPLTDEQKADMSEDQIKLWEERAKSGLLRGESTIRNGMFDLRGSLQGVVENDGAFKLLSDIGITTSKDYLNGGKLEVDEDKLRNALRDNPDDVYNMFVTGDGDEERGLIYRFDDALNRLKGNIERQAGRGAQTLDNYSLGKRMKEINERIEDYERRMVRVEQRYWTQFTQMEKAIARLTEQSNHLFSQFGGMM